MEDKKLVCKADYEAAKARGRNGGSPTAVLLFTISVVMDVVVQGLECGAGMWLFLGHLVGK